MGFLVKLVSLLSWFCLFFDSYEATQTACRDNDETACLATDYCDWIASTDCRCTQKDWAQDIAFIFDNTTQWSDTHFSYAVQFATNLLTYSTPNSTRVAILFTGLSDSTSTTFQTFTSETLATTISTILPSLTAKSSSTNEFHLSGTVTDAVALFQSESADATRKIIIIFAASDPNLAPCSVLVRDSGLQI